MAMNPFSAVEQGSCHDRGVLESLLTSLQLPGPALFGPEGDEPVYALPARAIDSLAGPNGRTGRRWLNTTQCEAEPPFARHCESWNCVGFQSQDRILYHLLTRKPLDLPDHIFVSMGWTAAPPQTFAGANQQLSEANRRLRGAAGWLLTEPAFLKEVDDLRTLYYRIPRDSRPLFPLTRIISAPGSISDAESQFGPALAKLLNRWGLMSLPAWGLPSPQGPLFPDYLPPGPRRDRRTASTSTFLSTIPLKATTRSRP